MAPKIPNTMDVYCCEQSLVTLSIFPSIFISLIKWSLLFLFLNRADLVTVSIQLIRTLYNICMVGVWTEKTSFIHHCNFKLLITISLLELGKNLVIKCISTMCTVGLTRNIIRIINYLLLLFTLIIFMLWHRIYKLKNIRNKSSFPINRW